MLKKQIKNEVTQFLKNELENFKEDRRQYEIEFMELTFATDNEKWNYQTGDNSFFGNAYSLPHWAVCSIDDETSLEDILESIFDQWEDSMFFYAD